MSKKGEIVGEKVRVHTHTLRTHGYTQVEMDEDGARVTKG